MNKLNQENPTPSASQVSGRFSAEIYEWVEAIVFSVAVVVLLFTFIFRIVGVDGISMLNTLHDKDRVIISMLGYKPRQGDIVVLSTKAVPQPIIKRIIAVGGQTVNIDYETHTVYVDGKPLDEPYIAQQTTFQGENPVKMPVKVPPNHVFVMGDNRNQSFDSRSSAIGMIDDRYIIGHAIFRIFPIQNAGVIR